MGQWENYTLKQGLGLGWGGGDTGPAPVPKPTSHFLKVYTSSEISNPGFMPVARKVFSAS